MIDKGFIITLLSIFIIVLSASYTYTGSINKGNVYFTIEVMTIMFIIYHFFISKNRYI